MELTYCIRKATARDSDALKICMESAYATFQERMEGVRLPPMDVDYSSEIENYPTWVVASEGSILGGLIMMFENDQATVANIAVNPRFQGQGIGGKLMRFAESRARESSFLELKLATHVLLEENLTLYRYLGWEETGRDETRVIMKKEL
jgi:ribosomal protein S18 acetylase RimI-like enzyme